MSRQPCVRIGRSGPGQRLMDTKCLFTPAIGLARHVDHRHNRALNIVVSIQGDGFTHYLRQCPPLQQPHFALSGARIVVVGIRNHGNEAHRFPVKLAISGLNRGTQPRQTFGVGYQGFQP